MNTSEAMITGKRLIEEMNNASWNAAIEEAAKILDAKSASFLSVAAENARSHDCAELQAAALLCLIAAVEVRNLKRE